MLSFRLYLGALSMMAVAAAASTNQNFTSSGEIDITSCPITYYGQRSNKVYVAINARRFSVCFNGEYKAGIKNDCILISGGTADRGGLSVYSKEIPLGSGVHKLLPHLMHAGKCVNVIPLKDSQQSQIEQIELGNFGSQAILAIRTYPGYTSGNLVADAQVNGRSVFRQKFYTNQTKMGVITDMSGCRLSGVVYKSNTTVTDPNTCSKITCNASGIATAVSDCGPMEYCNGNGRCTLKAVCTVMGPMVVSFLGKVHSVPDRCGYSLFKTSSIPGLEVLGVFQERRRKDISFLDRVILKLSSPAVQVSLEQGRVRLDNEVLNLKTTVTVVHGIELSKDKMGVTARMSASGYTVSIHFDGSIALIHLTGPSRTNVQGLCGSSSGVVSGEKVSPPHSAPSCDTQHTELANDTINCSASAEWCKVFGKAPFSTCHMYMDPEPFITACRKTLCSYPAVDGLKCRFLEAYVRGCSFYNVTVRGWDSQAGCSGFQPDVCSEMFCSEHEFCGRKKNGQIGCLCRALFASKYNATVPFGEPTACEHKAAKLTMAKCLLEARGINPSVLHLNDPSCKGHLDGETHMVTFDFNTTRTCGTVVTANNSQVVYKNTIMTRNNSQHGVIHRNQDVQIDFSCQYNQPDIKSFSFTLRDSSVKQQFDAGEWIYNLSMTAYTNYNTRETFQPGHQLKLDERLWVEIDTEGLDDSVMAVVTENCWATNQADPNADLRYDIIIKGCPNTADPTVMVMNNGNGTSNIFAFNTFQFSDEEGEVFMHCKLQLCIKDGNSCIPNCSPGARRRRSVARYVNQKPVLINLAWVY